MIQTIYFRDYWDDHFQEILKEIYIDKLYLPIFLSYKNPQVIDLGANIGLFTQFASLYTKRIISVEPSKKHFEILTKMIKFNKISAILENVAISTEIGEKILNYTGNSTSYSLIKLDETINENELVKTIDIETLYNKHNLKKVDILKMDVEGEEMRIIMSDNFANISKITNSIIVEYHEWCGASPFQFKARLEDLEYTVHQLPNNATVFYATKN